MFACGILYLILLINNTLGEVSADNNGTQLLNHHYVADEITKILNKLQKNNDKRVRPNYGEDALDVDVTIFIIDISSVSEIDMDFTVDMYFRQTWNDPRLKFKGPNGIKKIFVAPEFAKNVWIPDTYFANEKKSFFHTATTPNEYLTISQNGKAVRSIRLTVTASCPMDLRYFPMDTQVCAFEFLSYEYTTSDIRYKWANGIKAVTISSKVSLPQFEVRGYKVSRQTDIYDSGNYSLLACEIQFIRSMGYYMIQIYIPSSLIVMISWLSFWLSRNSTSARVALGVTTVLTMATLMSTANATLPKISYIKAMDVFLATCFLMVFASLLESTFVGYMTKRILIRKNWSLAQQLQNTEKALEKARNDEEEDYAPNDQTEVIKAETCDRTKALPLCTPSKNLDSFCGFTPFAVDKYSRILFPAGFIIFNLMYWIIYLRISNVSVDDLVLLGNKN